VSFTRPSWAELPPIADESGQKAVEALIRLEVACRLAIDALADVPSATEHELREPIEAICQVTGRELDRIKPGWRDSTGA
jgi:hypothetical protein